LQARRETFAEATQRLVTRHSGFALRAPPGMTGTKFIRANRSQATAAVIPRECGVSSTPRPFGSITSVSGILGHPHLRVTTPVCRFRSRTAAGTEELFLTTFVDWKFTTSVERPFTTIFDVIAPRDAAACLYRACNAD